MKSGESEFRDRFIQMMNRRKEDLNKGLTNDEDDDNMYVPQSSKDTSNKS